MSTEYGVSLKELQDLMEFRGHEAKEEVLKLGGVETITKKFDDKRIFGDSDESTAKKLVPFLAKIANEMKNLVHII